jgi:hypothetical protein
MGIAMKSALNGAAFTYERDVASRTIKYVGNTTTRIRVLALCVIGRPIYWNYVFSVIFRHPCAVQKQLGHSNPSITLNVNAHLVTPDNQSAATKLENNIFRPNGSKMFAENQKRAAASTATLRFSW